MKIEAGKAYSTRGGYVAIVQSTNRSSKAYSVGGRLFYTEGPPDMSIATVTFEFATWTARGRYVNDALKSDYDLVEELRPPNDGKGWSAGDLFNAIFNRKGA